MPQPRPLPDLHGIDPVEPQLAVLAVLEKHGFDAERRQRIIGEGRARLIDLIDDCGGAHSILRAAIARLRRSA
jgi:hypothetical protein